MVNIDVDFDVFKALTVRRKSEDMTENEVIRELLNLGGNTESKGEDRISSLISWVTKGVSFPHGTDFKVNYKGQIYKGKVQNGALVVNGKRFTSISAAAVAITGNNVNGWRFWQCKMPNTGRWRLATELRK